MFEHDKVLEQRLHAETDFRLELDFDAGMFNLYNFWHIKIPYKHLIHREREIAVRDILPSGFVQIAYYAGAGAEEYFTYAPNGLLVARGFERLTPESFAPFIEQSYETPPDKIAGINPEDLYFEYHVAVPGIVSVQLYEQAPVPAAAIRMLIEKGKSI